MSEETEEAPSVEALQARLAELQDRIEAANAEARARVVRAELKAAAARAGMVDLDGLKLVDLSAVSLDDKGEVVEAEALMTRLKREKPWLFGLHGSSSSRASAPPAQPPRMKLAREMTDDEYRAARAALLRPR